jgi:hypothetical protein
LTPLLQSTPPMISSTDASKQPARPALALRVGITGARSLNAADCDRLRDKVRAALAQAQQYMQQLATESVVGRSYVHGESQQKPVPVLHLISPLARGSDRLAAEEALKLGYVLHVAMPFPQTEYEKDFTGAESPEEPALAATEDLAQFRDLFARAGNAWLSLDGDHGPEANRSYEAVGRFVVRHSDLLLAIWDGKPSSGRGGTADIVRYAANIGVPVWWIHAIENRDPTWIADIQDLRDPLPPTDSPAVKLFTYLGQLIRPPEPVHRHRHGWIGVLAGLGQRGHVSPEAEYFNEHPLPRWGIWKAYSTLMRWASGVDPPWTPPRRPTEEAAAYWFDRYAPADARAGEYAARYRSSYVWVFALATAALTFGAVALALGMFRKTEPIALFATLVVVCAEAVALLAVVLLVGLALRLDWHERSIEYRLLAELCRKQQVLASIGWALSIGAVQRMAASDRAATNRTAWVAWLFAALQRPAPLRHGDLSTALPEAPSKAALDDLIEEQLNYHKGRGEMARRAGETFVRLGAWSFAAVFVCVVMKFLTTMNHWHEVALFFGLLAAVLPGVSAAFFGIRAYAELELLAEQSRHMEAELRRAKARLERLRLTHPLASQDLGAEATAVAMLMLQDLEGWARLFSVKAVEAG